LSAADLSGAQILSEPKRFEAIFERWTEKAQDELECGMQYSREIQNRRLRAATVLPALIGGRTLALLRDAGTMALQSNVKVRRGEVRRMILSLVVTFASRKPIHAMFERTKL
jgi:farnesyl-diphosphate farnesyltransferase